MVKWGANIYTTCSDFQNNSTLFGDMYSSILTLYISLILTSKNHRYRLVQL